MKSEDLYRAVGEVGEDLLERSEREGVAAEEKPPASIQNPEMKVISGKSDSSGNRKKTSYWIRLGAAAAVIFLIGFVGIRSLRMGSSGNAAMSTAEVTEEKAVAEDAAPAETFSMEAAAEVPEAEEAAPEANLQDAAEEEAAGEAETDEAVDAPAEVPAAGNAVMIDTGVIEEKAVLLVSPAAQKEEDYSAEKEMRSVPAATAFVESASGELLHAEGEENTVFSPLNLYLSLAMLTEITEGESRQEILQLLKADSVEELRLQTALLLAAASYDQDGGKSVPAASIWLPNGVSYHLNTLQDLAVRYNASSFAGEMGSSDYDAMLRDWINRNTEGLLSEYADSLTFDPNTMIALAGALYYKAGWQSEFIEKFTADHIFHAASGDRNVPMMQQLEELQYMDCGDYRAAGLPLADGNTMWFILPDENTDAEALLADGSWIGTILENPDMPTSLVDLTVPKFEISEKIDAAEWMRESGIRKIFEESTDFSPITNERIRLTEADHAAYVAIDEKGVTGAAYTYEAAAAEGAIEEGIIDFTLDRPFLFAVTNESGMVWFEGAVRNP